MFKARKRLSSLVIAGGLLISMSGAGAAPSYPNAVGLYNAGKYPQALSEFQALKAVYPNNAMIRYYCGLCEQSVGHIEQAKAEFAWVEANAPSSLKALAARGSAQLAGAKTQVSYSAPVIASASPRSMGQPDSTPKSKVKKIYEFWAEW